uniref:Uncharacterized protein n=1 Tax=Eptatretus burgeri TaxID=7764 RepID=A0A8C4N8U4_EPTBU
MCIQHAITKAVQHSQSVAARRNLRSERLSFQSYGTLFYTDGSHYWLLQPVNATGHDGGHPCLAYEQQLATFSVQVTWRFGSWYQYARVRIFFASPVFSSSTKCWPARRSLLAEYNLSPLHEGTLTPLASNETINLYNIVPGLLIGVSKITNEQVFASVNFHTMRLYERCMLGSSQRPYHAMSMPTANRLYMTPYHCVVSVYAQGRTVFETRFNNRFITPDEVRRGWFRCHCIRTNNPNNHSFISLPLGLTFNNELFPDCCLITACIGNDDGQVLLACAEYSHLTLSERLPNGSNNLILKALASDAEVKFELQHMGEISTVLIITGLSVAVRLGSCLI